MRWMGALIATLGLWAAIAATGAVYAQTSGVTAPPAPQAPWMSILGVAINAVGTMVIVKVLAHPKVIPSLRTKYPAMLPVISGVVAPFLALAQTKLAVLTGVPIALGIPEVLAIFSGGGGAIGLAQIGIQRRRQQSLRGLTATATLPADGAPI